MICRICLLDKPETSFMIRKETGRRRSDCTACVGLRATAWAKKNKIRRAEINHKSYAKEIGKDPEECRRKYVHLTPEERSLTFYQRHPDKVKFWVKRREKREAAKISDYNKKKYQANKDEYREKFRQYRKNNPHKMTEYTAKRRAADKQAQPKWLTAIQKAQIQEFYEIARALRTQTGVMHHVDHVFPLRHRKFCGLHVPWNLQVLTASENQSKHLKVPREFERLLFADAT